MLNIKKYIKTGASKEAREKKDPTKNPWLIEVITNGIRATNIIEFASFVRPNKKIQPKYFENDRILGIRAYEGCSILRVTDLFEELRDVTPNTVGYVFQNTKYIYHGDGILKISKNKDEEYISNKTLANENVDNFFQLEHAANIIIDQDDDEYQDGATVYSSSTELEKI